MRRENRLDTLARQEFEVVRKIIDDDDIVRAIIYNDEDIWNEKLIIPSKDERDSLVFNFIYPHDFIPFGTDTDPQVSKTYITISFTDYRPTSSTRFKANSIQINILVHQDNEKIVGPTMTRSKFIASRIDDLFNDKRGFGIGRLNFYGMNTIRISEKYQGYSMRYRMEDFN